MSTSFVSVILPVYNGAQYLNETIDSVLMQAYPTLELIVVNDGSVDNSEGICKTYQNIRYVYQENQGVPFARNHGVSLAKGEFLSFIDQDDLWMPGKCEAQMMAFQKHPHLGYCLTRQEFYLTENVERPDWCPEDWLNRPVAGFSPSTLMIRKTLFEKMGPFDTSLPTGSDTEFFFQLKDADVPFTQLEEIYVRKRIHQDNQSKSRDALRRDIMETLRRSIHRQRAQTRES